MINSSSVACLPLMGTLLNTLVMDSTMDLFNFLICMVNKVFVTMVTVDILNVAILNGKFDFFIETSG